MARISRPSTVDSAFIGKNPALPAVYSSCILVWLLSLLSLFICKMDRSRVYIVIINHYHRCNLRKWLCERSRRALSEIKLLSFCAAGGAWLCCAIRLRPANNEIMITRRTQPVLRGAYFISRFFLYFFDNYNNRQCRFSQPRRLDFETLNDDGNGS